ncbi:MAG: TonB-dependent receptor domain-containing protein [bacterium]
MKFNKRFVLFTVLLLQCRFIAAGQTFAGSDDNLEPGTIRGKVIDTDKGVPLSDVNVIITGYTYGSATAKDGTFLLERIPAGIYTLKISRIGYRLRRIEKVLVKSGGQTVLDVQLQPAAIEFDAVILSASRKEQTVNMAPASVSVVRSSDIEQRNASTFDQALESVTGVSIQRTIGVSVQSLSLRGSSDVAGGGVGNRVMLAIDGRPALSSDSGGALWSLVPTNFIERIEVVKGAHSSLYGSTAMGGVINVITKKPVHGSTFKINVYSGLFETPPQAIRHKNSPGIFHTVELNHSNRWQNFGYLLSLSHKESNGHRQRSAYEFTNLYGKLFFDLTHNRYLEVTVGSDIGRNDYPHTWFSNLEPLRVAPKNTDNVQKKKTFSTDVYYYAVPSAKLKYSARFYFYRQLFKSEFNPNDVLRVIPDNEPFGLFIRSDSRKLGNLTQLDYTISDKNVLIAGLDIQRDFVDSAPDTILYGKRQVNNLAVYFQDEHHVSRSLTFNVGLRYDFNKLEGGKTLTKISPKAAMVFAPVENWSLRLLAGRGFRAPTIAERFFQREIAGGTRFRPNPGLRAEKVTSFELGSRVKIDGLADLDLALFHNTYDDMIYWINITEEAGLDELLFQVRNLNKARMQGVEVSLNFYPKRFLTTNVNYTYLDAEDLSETQRVGFLAYKVRHSFNFTTAVHTGPWRLNFNGRYNSRVEKVFLYPNDKPGAFFVFGGKIRREFNKNLTVSIGVKNIFNTQYEELARYRMPGRNWTFGLSYEM